MDPECKKITKIIVPAVRAVVIDVMNERYNYNQKEIARRLGITQVAVSKYLNRKYSKNVATFKAKVSAEIDKHMLSEIITSRNSHRASGLIERVSEQMIYL